MKLAELMNDDTCQILLAIIVGIVICYFIFGTGCGSCNRDGFSVGGQSCIGGATQDGRLCADLRETACLRNAVDCTWTPGEGAAAAQGTGCSEIGPSGQSFLSEITTTCQIGEGEDGAEAVNFFDQTGRMNPAFQYTSECCELIRNIPSGCRAQDSELDTIIDQNDQNTLRNDLDTMTNMCDAQAYAAAPLPPPAATAAVKYSYILQDMANAITSLSGPGFDTGIFDDMKDTSGKYVANYTNFNDMRTIAEEKGIYFQLLMNDHTTDPEKVNKGYTDQYNSIAFARSESPLTIITSDNAEIGYEITTEGAPQDGAADYGYRNASTTLRLGDLFGTYALAPQQVKKDSYCKRNSMTIATGIQKIDPLLKMKSRTFLNDKGYAYCKSPYFPNVCRDQQAPITNRPARCEFFIANENLEPNKNDIPDATELSRPNNMVAEELLKISDDPTKGSGDRADIEYLVFNYNNNRDRLLPNGIRNQYELIMNDSSFSLDLSKYTNDPLTKLIHVDGNDIDISSHINFHTVSGLVTDRGPGADRQTRPVRFELPPNSNHYTLIKAFGMSQNIFGDIYVANAMGDPGNDYVNNYYSNLLQIQYLITKIIIGTDRYLGRNLNIYNKNVQVTDQLYSSPSQRPSLPDDFDYIDNDICAVQGRDWLLLVYITKPSVGPLGSCDSNTPTITNDLGVNPSVSDQPVGLLCALPQPAPYIKKTATPPQRCNIDGRTVQVGYDGNITKCSDVLDDSVEANRSSRCANNCDGCYQVVDDVAHVCKDALDDDSRRVCDVDLNSPCSL